MVEYLLRLGELTLKKGTRPYFERKLKDNIKKRLKGLIEKFDVRNGRYYLQAADGNEDRIEDVLSTTFGIVAFHKCQQCEKNLQDISKIVLSQACDYANNCATFKIEARRSDKGFALNSYQLASELGGVVLAAYPNLNVNVREPDFTIYIEIRHRAFIYSELKEYKKTSGGLPVGMSGRGMLLLSGGLDSPVAGWMMAKRGMFLSAVHFHTPPYTSDEALDKARRLALKLAPWNIGIIDFYSVNFTEIQLKINQIEQKEYATILGRACMMLISAKIAKRLGAMALITGEALSQVASQTTHSLNFTNAMSSMLVLRPCIGMDKQEITSIAYNIDTFKTSIIAETDCCSLFAPLHPIIHPDFSTSREIFESLSIESLLEDAAKNAIMEKLSEEI